MLAEWFQNLLVIILAMFLKLPANLITPGDRAEIVEAIFSTARMVELNYPQTLLNPLWTISQILEKNGYVVPLPSSSQPQNFRFLMVTKGKKLISLISTVNGKVKLVNVCMDDGKCLAVTSVLEQNGFARIAIN